MRIFGWALLLILGIACAPKGLPLATPASADHVAQQAYRHSIMDQRDERLQKLTSPQGWLSVVGLHWLEEGVNSIGAAPDNSIQFPSITTETIGAYQLTGSEVFFGKVEGIEVLSEGGEYLGGPVEIGWPPIVLNHGPLYWYVLKRGEKYGIRLKDTTAHNRTHFAGLEYFDIDDSYKLTAEVIKATQADSVAITNVLGNVRKYPVAAFLEFTREGQDYSMSVLDEGGDNYFLVFADQTSGAETYGGGRFLYPPKPCDSCAQVTVLDFNLAQNPPCAFTDFATCPLPPEANKLSFMVKSGEKSAINH